MTHRTVHEFQEERDTLNELVLEQASLERARGGSRRDEPLKPSR